jgi:hypothetical protein
MGRACSTNAVEEEGRKEATGKTKMLVGGQY